MSSRTRGNDQERVTRIIACSVFRPALDYLLVRNPRANLRTTYLPSNLHVKPLKLKRFLSKEVAAAKKRGERVVCLYGECFPDISEFCDKQDVKKISGFHCYEMLLGSGEFKKLIDETAGTYFLEQDLIRNFESYCAKPLELHDEEMRKYCFEHYQKLLYVRQPDDPDLVAQAQRLADFLGLSLEIRDADYSHLETELMELIGKR